MYEFFVTPWTVALQAPLSMGFPRQDYWSGLPFHLLGDLPDPGIQPVSLMSPALAGGFFMLSHQRSPNLDLALSFFSQAKSQGLHGTLCFISLKDHILVLCTAQCLKTADSCILSKFKVVYGGQACMLRRFSHV